MADLEKILNELSSLTILQASELTKMLEEKWGVSALSPVSVAAAGAPVNADLVVEKTEFDLILSSVGEKKIEVIKVVREITGLGLKEAKDLVDSAPKSIKSNLNKSDAENFKLKLESVGAKVELK